VIVGGGRSDEGGNWSSVAHSNIITGSSFSMIGGGRANTLNNSSYGNILGGGNNSITGNSYSTVVGGQENEILGGVYGRNFIGGGGYAGLGNKINNGDWSSIVGGYNNVVSGNYSSVIGGVNNNVTHNHSHIIGSNINSFTTNTTHVEKLNVKTLNGTTAVTALAIDANGMVVDGSSLDTGGAFTHTASGRIAPTNAYGNVNTSNYSSILGGSGNNISASTYSSIIGGSGNTIAGGTQNVINSGKGSYISSNLHGYNLIAGGGYYSGQRITGSDSSMIGGGYGNKITDNNYSSIVGGWSNEVRGNSANINPFNAISNLYGSSFIGGGGLNIIEAYADYSVIVGGGQGAESINPTTLPIKANNLIRTGSTKSFIGGGVYNMINFDSPNSSIIGGTGNTVNHSDSHVIGTNITSVSANTTHVERLNIGTLDGITATTSGGTEIQNIGIETGGIVTKGWTTKSIDIGDWNMDSTDSKTVSHGLSTTEWRTIRRMQVLIRGDADNAFYDLNMMNTAAGGQIEGGIDYFDASDIFLNRYTTGFFDALGFSSTSFNRGWITFDYIAD
jgi:hypothetical protein